jgi:hypothetical protein
VDHALEAPDTATLSLEPAPDVLVPDVFRPVADLPVAETGEFAFAVSAALFVTLPAALLVSR